MIYILLPARILHRAGYSGWWVVLSLVPFVNIIMVWVFAFSTWSAMRPRPDEVEKVFE